MAKINLLDRRRKEIVSRQAQASRYNLMSFVALGVVSLLAFGSLGYRLILSNRLADIDEQVVQRKKEIDSFEELARESVAVSRRIDAIATILAGREALQAKLALFFQIFESGVELRQAGFGSAENVNQLEVGGVSPSVAGFNEFSEFLQGLAEEGRYKELTLESLSRGDLGDYRFSYVIELTDAVSVDVEKG